MIKTKVEKRDEGAGMLCKGKGRVDGCLGVVEAWGVQKLRGFGIRLVLLFGSCVRVRKGRVLVSREWVSYGPLDGQERPWLSHAGSIGSQDVSCCCVLG